MPTVPIVATDGYQSFVILEEPSLLCGIGIEFEMIGFSELKGQEAEE